MSHNDILAADIAQHAGSHLAGMGAGFLVVDVLGAERDRRPLQHGGHLRDIHIGRAHGQLRRSDRRQTGLDPLDQGFDAGERTVHFPVTGDQWLTHYRPPVKASRVA